MRKFKILLEYEGTRYQGWQSQLNGQGIQDVLQKKLEKITKKKTNVVASGRTDAGVHAEGQVAHFRTLSVMTPREFLKALNSLLPHDIAVKKVEEVSLDFHAQLYATHKTYRYTILNRDYPSALHCRYSHYMATPDLNVTAMRKAAKMLVGKMDFKAFQGSGCSAKSSVREIFKITVAKKGDFIQITVDGDGFLKYMVRNIVGTLIEIGSDKMPVEHIKELLKMKNRRLAGPTAPSRGLCLVKVTYGKSPTKKKVKRG